jgi:CBS domain-containing protein
MAAVATDITTNMTTLCDGAFAAFCEDIAGMFDLEIRCERRQAAMGTVQSLREHFKKLTVVHSIHAEGTLHGTFHLIFGPGGLFILGGVIVMLPEARILEYLKRGVLQGAESLQDAAQEAGNLLVGSWNRVFRESCPGHKHFLKTGTFIGKPWDSPGQAQLQTNEEALTVLYDMTIEAYPSFECAAVFPTMVLNGTRSDGTEPGKDPSTIEEPKAEEARPKAPADPKPQALVSNPAPDVRPASGVLREAPAAVPNVASGGVEPRSVPAEVKKPPVPDPKPKTGSSPAAGPAEPSHKSDTMFLDPAYVLSQPGPADQALTDLLQIPAAQIMEKDVVWAGPEETVQDVIAKMQQHNVGYVLVGQNGVLEGLVSNSNILGAVSVYLRPMFAKWRRPADDATLSVKVKWIMSRPVRTIRPDTTLAATIESMRRCGGRCLPVVDAQGTVQGIVSVFDILLRILEVENNGSWQGRPPQAPALLI